jgi:hypothetical protein
MVMQPVKDPGESSEKDADETEEKEAAVTAE